MKCKNCGSNNLKVVDSRSNDDFVYRRRRCAQCGKLIHTKEYEDSEAKSEITKISNEKYNKIT